MISKTTTTRYDVAEHLRTPEEMADFLEACLEEAEGDTAFIAKALDNIARLKICRVHSLTWVYRRRQRLLHR